MTISDGTKTCRKEVSLSACDKVGYRAYGDKFECVPSTGRRVLDFSEDCPMNIAAYLDVVKCNAVQNANINVGCDMIVP